MLWLKFLACLGIIIVAGTRLSKYGDILAEKSGLGRAWVGAVLLAGITSLPELAAGISSVALVESPDLTMGDLFGAALVNLAVVALIDIVGTNRPLFHFMGTGILLTTGLSMLVMAFATISILLAHAFSSPSILGLVSIYSLILFCLYILSQYILFRFNATQADLAHDGDPQEMTYALVSLKRTLLYFVLSAIAAVGAGIWLAFIGDEISESTGLKASFVGTLFLALTTTAPEMAVSVSAARLGALEMAVGNVIGSNLFNIGVIIFINDLLFRGGPIFEHVSTGHVLTALFALILSSIVIIGIVFRPKSPRKGWVGIDTTLIGIIYLVALVSLRFFGG